jgi:CheY-like chemotaxis protein
MVRATFDVPAEIWPVDVDVGQIGQVMSNLVINAQQAMSGAGTVSITAENVLLDERIAPKLTPGRYVSIAVADHGCGVAPDDLSRIFDLYYTTKPRGSGLGLATAFAIINNHNGLITVDSELGQGTTFRILLPASTSHVDEEEKPDDRPITGKGRILLMDDEKAIRDLADDLLTLLGYQVEVSCEGGECVSMYQNGLAGGIPFDAVILDLTVPGGMGGCAAVERLREIDPQVRAIVSSGYSDDPVMANYREWGFVGVIPKPYDASEISQVLNTVLANPNAATD